MKINDNQEIFEVPGQNKNPSQNSDFRNLCFTPNIVNILRDMRYFSKCPSIKLYKNENKEYYAERTVP
jgi:hypothetical protein